MKISNKKRAVKLKRIFFLGSVFLALVALLLFLFDYTLFAIGVLGVFSIWYLFFHVADYHFIEFNDANGKIILRYYKAVRFGKGQFHSIEFPQGILQNAYFENSVFGKLSDLTFIVKTRRGLAEYPSISLSAVSLADRQKIQQSLNKILGL